MSLIDFSKYDIVLGSSSERRKQILQEVLKIPVNKILKPSFEENFSKQCEPCEYVHMTSREKMSHIIQENEFTKPTIIICCDTIINCNGTIVEKPITKQNQLDMFNSYKKHPQLQVISSIHVSKIDGTNTTEPIITGDEVITNLYFDVNISNDILQQYVECEEGLEVAGGFKYQEMGNILFLSIDGDYFNVVGLPAKKTFELLKQLM